MNKILLVPEFSFYGGTFTYFKDVMHFYYSQKYEVAVVLNKEQLSREVIDLLNKYGYKFIVFPRVKKFFTKLRPKFLFQSFFNFLNLLPVYFKIKPDITVISTGTPGNLLSLMFLPSRFLYVLHTYPVQSKRAFLIKLFLKLNLGKKKKIITVSEFSKKEIIKVWGLFKKEGYINVIYNTSMGGGKSVLSKNIETESNEKIRVLTVGHLRWYKNPLLWIEVAEIVNKIIFAKNIEFIWSGDGELLSECQRLIKTLNLNNVGFTGYQKEVENLINSCDIYFQPSAVESFGMCVLDAMRLGKPCIVSDAGGLPEIVLDNETGYIINVNDKKMMAEKLILLSKDKNLRLDMGKAGESRFNSCFSYRIWQKKMINLHNSLLGN